MANLTVFSMKTQTSLSAYYTNAIIMLCVCFCHGADIS